jgi:two-component system, OmpR family, response regulator
MKERGGEMAKQAKKVRIYSALEVANICGVVNQTAINWIKNGHLKAFTTPGGQYRIYAEDLLEFLTSRGMRVPSEVEEVANREKKQLLIVDDDENLNNMLRMLFEKQIPEFDILQAFDGFEAGKMIAEHGPTVIVLDMNLPGVDGHRLLRTIKEDTSLNHPKIVSISGIEGEIADRERILEEGADVFLEKPVDTTRIVEAVRGLVMLGSARG